MRTAIVLCVVGLTVGLVAAPALAHKKKYSSTIAAQANAEPAPDFDKGTYSGKVSSLNPKCIANRMVRVVVTSGGILATVFTAKSGSWVTPRVTLGADLIAVEAKTLKKNKKHRHTCKAAQAQGFQT